MESVAQKGAAHLLSSAAFSGYSGPAAVKFFESIGAKLGTSVDREKISYSISVLNESDQLELAVKGIIKAISTPPEETYVLEEAKETAAIGYAKLAADPAQQIHELVHAAAFGEGSPLGASLYAASESQVSAADALAFRNETFVSGNLVVSGSGVEQKTLEELVARYAGQWLPRGPRRVVKQSPFLGGELRQRADLGGAVLASLAFPAPIGEQGKPYAVLAALLSSAGLSPFLHAYSTGALLGVTTSDPTQLQTAAQLLKLVASGSPAALAGLSAVKTKAALSQLLALESSAAAGLLVDGLVTGGGLRADQLADLRGVSAEAVAQAARDLLASAPAYAVLGSTASAPTYATVLGLLK